MNLTVKMQNFDLETNKRYLFQQMERKTDENCAQQSDLSQYNGEISLSHKSRKRIREAKKKARPGKHLFI